MNKTIDITGLKVRVCQNVWEKINGWCTSTNLECSGFGLVRRKGSMFTIYDAFLPSQVCTPGHTTGDTSGLSDIAMSLFKRGIPTEHLKLWWHTHATFGCFWSGTDDDTAKRLSNNADGYGISIVTNHKNEYKARIDATYPFQFTLDDIELEFIESKKNRWVNWKYQVGRKVKEAVFEAPKFDYHKSSHWFMAEQDYGPEWEKDGTAWRYVGEPADNGTGEPAAITLDYSQLDREDQIDEIMKQENLWGWCSERLGNYVSWFDDAYEIREQVIGDLWDEEVFDIEEPTDTMQDVRGWNGL